MRHARSDYNRIQDPDYKIPEDEPVFIIRGQDVAGPDAVRAWAALAKANGASPDIVIMAKDWAEVMEQYQTQTGRCKVPDLPR